MKSKIFKRSNGTFTLNEFEDSIQNKSVIPPKYSPTKKAAELRRQTHLKT
jgi:hypothetical protein